MKKDAALVQQLREEMDTLMKKITATKNQPQEIAKLKQQIEEMQKIARSNTISDDAIIKQLREKVRRLEEAPPQSSSADCVTTGKLQKELAEEIATIETLPRQQNSNVNPRKRQRDNIIAKEEIIDLVQQTQNGRKCLR